MKNDAKIRMNICEENMYMENIDVIDNRQKYFNYKTQMVRLKKAISSEYYLEALFIEYAIIEDRTEAILRYEGNSIKCKEGGFVSIDKKLNKISAIAREKKSLPNRYFDEEFIEEIRLWKTARNGMIHALMKKTVSTQEILEIVIHGENIVKKINRLSGNYKRAVERLMSNFSGGMYV